MRALIEGPEDLGRFVRRIRRDANMTQRQVADALGTSQRYLSELEAGKPKRIDQGYFEVLRKLGIVLTAETLDDGVGGACQHKKSQSVDSAAGGNGIGGSHPADVPRPSNRLANTQGDGANPARVIPPDDAP